MFPFLNKKDFEIINKEIENADKELRNAKGFFEKADAHMNKAMFKIYKYAAYGLEGAKYLALGAISMTIFKKCSGDKVLPIISPTSNNYIDSNTNKPKVEATIITLDKIEKSKIASIKNEKI